MQFHNEKVYANLHKIPCTNFAKDWWDCGMKMRKYQKIYNKPLLSISNEMSSQQNDGNVSRCMYEGEFVLKKVFVFGFNLLIKCLVPYKWHEKAKWFHFVISNKAHDIKWHKLAHLCHSSHNRNNKTLFRCFTSLEYCII